MYSGSQKPGWLAACRRASGLGARKYASSLVILQQAAPQKNKARSHAEIAVTSIRFALPFAQAQKCARLKIARPSTRAMKAMSGHSCLEDWGGASL